VLLASALLAVTPVAPATAAAVPAQVGLVSFVGASLTSSGATLTVDWADVKGATSYQVFASTSYDGVTKMTKPSVTVTSSKAKVTRLSPGRDYYVQVRAVSAAGRGPGSPRVGHGTITAEATLLSGTPKYRLLSWNICSNACGSLKSRAKVIRDRIKELKPDIVALQEASKFTKALSGYKHVVNGQNDILVRSSQFSLVKKKAAGATSGSTRFASTHATSGKGVAWAALKHRTGRYVVAFDVHLVTGTSKAAVKQREYEAGKLASFISSTLKKLKKSHGSLADWTKVPVVILGDFNTHKSRTGDDTMSVLEKRNWYDAFDQARTLTRQHHNTANPDWKTTPEIGKTWGAHTDKVVIRPTRSVVYSWQNAGKMSGGKYVAPLGSDHHPVMVDVSLR
jgi:endonuclease/exonuclease/phosphatase family metal-dependent hydrolase